MIIHGKVFRSEVTHLSSNSVSHVPVVVVVHLVPINIYPTTVTVPIVNSALYAGC